jgi:antirestriction protein ArdC
MDAHFAVSFQAQTSNAHARAEWPRQITSGRRGAAWRLRLNLEDREDHASYIGSWLQVLRDDKRAIFAAAAHAQRAADFLHGLQPLIEVEAAE